MTFLDSITEHTIIITGLLIAISCFVSFLLLTGEFAKSKIFPSSFKDERHQMGWVIFQRMVGVLILGLIPLMVIITSFNQNPFEFGLTIPLPFKTLLYILPIGAILILVNSKMAPKPGNLEMYPQFRVKNWYINIFVANLITWAAYLYAYEFFFRGFLFFAFQPVLGTWLNITINTAAYSIAHLHKGKRETLASIPFGIVLCLITLDTQSIFASFMLHLILAVSNDIFSIKAHPDMSFRLSNSYQVKN